MTRWRRRASAVAVVAMLAAGLVMAVRRAQADGVANDVPPPAVTGADPSAPVPPAGGSVPTTIAAAPGHGRDAPAADRLAAVRSWSFALGVPVAGRSSLEVADQFAGFDLVVLDGDGTPAEAVAALRDRGSIVLGYANVGAIEQGRPWSSAASAYRLDYWDQWDEWYADVSQAGFRSLVTDQIVSPILTKGFDGIFLDNVDMVDTHPEQRAAMVGLVAELSVLVRSRGGYVFAQNGEDPTIDAILPYLDGWNREDVSFTFDDEAGTYRAVTERDRHAALATVRRVRSRDVLVTTVDYVADPEGPEAAAALQAACREGAIATIGDIGLTRTFPPRRC